MKKICEWCKCEFNAKRAAARFCSRKCDGMARRKATFEHREAKAKALGITVEELARMARRQKRGIHWKRDMKRPKTYREIRAANRKHPIVAGWRGQPVMGGGAGVRHNDPWLKPSEYARCPGVVSKAEKKIRRARYESRKVVGRVKRLKG